MAFCWRADDDPSWNAGLVDLSFSKGSGPVLLKTLYFCDFPGGVVRTPCPPSGSAHVIICSFKENSIVLKRVDDQVSLTKKTLTLFFCCFFVFCFFEVLSLSYRSQMVNFKEIYQFSRFMKGSNISKGGSNFFQGGGGPIAYSL